MKSFKPGDVVKVIAGPRAGEIATVTDGPLRALGRTDGYGFPVGTIVYVLDLKSFLPESLGVAALPEWIIHYREDHEPADQSLDEILNGIRRGVRVRS